MQVCSRKTIGVALLGLITGAAPAWAQAKASPEGSQPAAFSIRLTAASAQTGYERVEAAKGRVLYVATAPLVTQRDVKDSRADDAHAPTYVSLTFTREAAERIGKAPTGTVAIYLGSAFVTTGRISAGAAQDSLTISHLAAGSAARIARALILSVVPSTPTIMLVPRHITVRPGESFGVDVYVAGALDVRGFQLALDTAGGSGGSLQTVKIETTKTREDYVFFGGNSIEQGNMSRGFMIGALMSGGVDAMRPRYMTTFTYEATSTAKGTFKIHVRPDRDTMLAEPSGDSIPFRAVDEISVKVESTRHITPARK